MIIIGGVALAVCPLMSTSDKQTECIENGCAFWYEISKFERVCSGSFPELENWDNSKLKCVTEGNCAVVSIAQKTNQESLQYSL